MVIVCPHCHRKLGEEIAGHGVIRHKGREIIGHLHAIRCEECGAVWSSAPEEGNGTATTERLAKPNSGLGN